MMPNETVCVDASLVVALLIPERYSALATDLWETWVKQDFRIAAPALLAYEVTSALYRKVFRGIISREDGKSALRQFVNLEIDLITLDELNFSAIDLAAQYQRPNTYDAHYLALSKHLASVLWTADERLFNSVKSTFSLIRWVADGVE